MHPQALMEKYVKDPDGIIREIGIPQHCRETLKQMEQNIVYTETPTKIADGIYVTGEIPRVTEYEDVGGPFFTDEACTIPDPLHDDQSLFFDTPYGLVLIAGCAHSGIVNTLMYIRKLVGEKAVYAIIGGMHLLRASEERMARTIQYIKELDIKNICIGHCTGAGQIHEMYSVFPEQVENLFVGKILNFELNSEFSIKQ
jgi:7,8-dihydropterin-6-yl-methyl-4-(beta-D-ribofuranosyl)aminobenzene 5'-phosphate synthase